MFNTHDKPSDPHQYEDAVKRLNLPETQTLLIDPKISIYTDAIGSFAEDCHDKTLINRAAPIFKKAMTIKMNEREKAALMEAYNSFIHNNK